MGQSTSLTLKVALRGELQKGEATRAAQRTLEGHSEGGLAVLRGLLLVQLQEGVTAELPKATTCGAFRASRGLGSLRWKPLKSLQRLERFPQGTKDTVK